MRGLALKALQLRPAVTAPLRAVVLRPKPVMLSLDEIRAALARAQRLLPPASETRLRIVPSTPEPLEEEEREGAGEIRTEELLLQEINGCKTLLLEIIRRTAYDWVLYRTSTRLVQKSLAEAAFHWLFDEEPGTEEWKERERQGKYITSFVGICDSLELDPATVRGHIRRLTPRNVISVGRPAEYRRRDVFTSHEYPEGAYALPTGVLEPDTLFDDGVSDVGTF